MGMVGQIPLSGQRATLGAAAGGAILGGNQGAMYVMRGLFSILALGSAMILLVVGCSSSPGEVTDKVLADWGLKERPEGYETASDKVYERLGVVGQQELERMQRENRDGEIKFEQDGLTGNYYKEQRRYENYYPLDARASSRGGRAVDSGYYGYIEYAYRVMQGPRFSNRTEAEASTADIPTGDEGRVIMRYRFTGGGTWDGGKGEVTDR
jgi:hypothetical protein